MPWSDREHEALIDALAVVCETTATELSDAAKKFLLGELTNAPAAQVMGALKRCAHECKGRLTLADILTRLDDGRPGAEEAWASFPKREEDAGLVTDEMSAAWGVAGQLHASDEIAARMAFKEAYSREVVAARANRKPVCWRVSPGFSKESTAGIVREGLARGLITAAQARHYLPDGVPDDSGRALPPHAARLIPENIRPLIAQIGTGRFPRPEGERPQNARNPAPFHETEKERE